MKKIANESNAGSPVKTGSVLRLTTVALLSALAVVIGLWRFPIFAAAPFLTVDFADVPIVLVTLLFGPLPGLGALFCVSAIQAFMLGGSGIIGFIMHMIASGTMLFVVWAVWRTRRNMLTLVLGLIAGTLAMAVVMIPLNYLLTPLYTGAPVEAITQLLLPVLIPFNLIKAASNCLLAGIFFRILRPFLKKQFPELID